MTVVDFSKPVVDLLAKRAATYCSNPDCGVLTCGPAEDADKAIIIGEAAHIFGARVGSARYLEVMSDEERGDSPNGIWLCRNCHKLIDSDPLHYPADLLFAWRRWHEEAITDRLGKPGDLIRKKILQQQLQGFEGCSPLAQQIIIDKPDYWEFKLTVEILRGKLAPVISRWRALSGGLYVKQTKIITLDEWRSWNDARFEELPKLIGAFAKLVEEELLVAWGMSDEPGDSLKILRACDLVAECAQGVLQWEEAIRFSLAPPQFTEMHMLLAGVGGRLLDQFERIPKEIAQVFELPDPTGTHHIKLTIDLPEGWVEKYQRAAKRVAASISDRGSF